MHSISLTHHAQSAGNLVGAGSQYPWWSRSCEQLLR